MELALFDGFCNSGGLLGGLLKTQHPIGQYRVDFAFDIYKGTPIKLVVEVDGHDWHSTKEQRERDAKRDRFLLSEGWVTMRFPGTEVYRDAKKCAREVGHMLVRQYDANKRKARRRTRKGK